MGRRPRNDCDYFPFYVKQGKTFSLLRRRWPLEGIGFFTELCILLTRTPNHHIKVESDIDFEYMLGDMGCSIDRANEIMELLAATGKVHTWLWENARVIVIPDLLDSLEFAYERRASEIISVEDIELMYAEKEFSGSETTAQGAFPGASIPKGKESKGKESKGKNRTRFSPDLSFIESDDWRELWATWISSKPDPFKTQRGVVAKFTELQNISGGDLNVAKQIVDNALDNEWKGLYALKGQMAAPKTEYEEVEF